MASSCAPRLPPSTRSTALSRPAGATRTSPRWRSQSLEGSLRLAEPGAIAAVRTLVHLSDLHTGRVDPALLAPLTAAIADARPHLVVFSGDLTQRATRTQFREARAFLDGLTAPYLVIPGNHDVPLWNVARRFVTPLARYKRFITTDLEPVFQDDEIVVVGVNTARSFTWGEGRISRIQVAAALQRLRAV